jgi:hypothetical protein
MIKEQKLFSNLFISHNFNDNGFHQITIKQQRQSVWMPLYKKYNNLNNVVFNKPEGRNIPKSIMKMTLNNELWVSFDQLMIDVLTTFEIPEEILFGNKHIKYILSDIPQLILQNPKKKDKTEIPIDTKTTTPNTSTTATTTKSTLK